jgi:flagellar protein FlbD
MIKLTRLNGEAFLLNAELIRYVESRPDTFVTLTGGERLVVRETMDDVLERCLAYQRAKHLLPTPAAAGAPLPNAPHAVSRTGELSRSQLNVKLWK